MSYSIAYRKERSYSNVVIDSLVLYGQVKAIADLPSS